MNASIPEQTMQRTADAATAIAVAATGYSWISQANEILQLVATLVAIVSGGFAAYYYWSKSRHLNKDD
jgi:hypothetical protein